MDFLDALLRDAARDRHRPWIRQTTGGLLAVVVLAAIVGLTAIELLGRPSSHRASDVVELVEQNPDHSRDE